MLFRSGAVFDSPGLPLERAWTGNAFADIVLGAPALVVPWLLCGLLGVLVARLLTQDAVGASPAPAQETASAPEQAHQRG